MTMIELDAANWKTLDDFYDGLLEALGAPEWHGRNINALLDSMIWTDQINTLKPPYVVRITGADAVPYIVKAEIELAERSVKIAREEYPKWRGKDVEVTLESDLKWPN